MLYASSSCHHRGERRRLRRTPGYKTSAGSRMSLMGKLKRSRQKAHQAAQRRNTERLSQKESGDVHQSLSFPKTTWDMQSDIFKSIKIDSAILQQSLPDFDARSGITNKSLKELNLNKRSKQRLRHELWFQKLDAVSTAKKKEKEKKKRQQTAVVGDMQPLHDCLPTLELLMTPHQHPHAASVPKQKAVAKEKQRRKQQMQDMAVFAQVLQHTAFKEKPVDTIKEHLVNKIKLEDQMDAV